jgi:hypothetical protein
MATDTTKPRERRPDEPDPDEIYGWELRLEYPDGSFRHEAITGTQEAVGRYIGAEFLPISRRAVLTVRVLDATRRVR